MKKTMMFILMLSSISVFSDLADATECFSNHDCPDVDMNCVRGICKNSIYSKGKSHSRDEETQRLRNENSRLENETRDLESENKHMEMENNTNKMRQKQREISNW